MTCTWMHEAAWAAAIVTQMHRQKTFAPRDPSRLENFHSRRTRDYQIITARAHYAIHSNGEGALGRKVLDLHMSAWRAAEGHGQMAAIPKTY